MNVITTQNPYDPDYPEAKYVLADDAFRFQPAMIAFNAIIIISSVLHFCLSVWGIAVAAIAIHRDVKSSQVNSSQSQVKYHVLSSKINQSINQSAAPAIGNNQDSANGKSEISNVVVAGNADYPVKDVE